MTTQLEHFLNYYMNTEAPGYAVLVTGDWGTGKTFQVCHYLAEKERWYVSVYGLGSANDIHSAILSQIDPKLELTKTAVTKIGEMSKNVGGLFAVGNVLSGMANNILRCELKPCRTLVLDDLERTCLKMKDLLGVINEYVEHQDFRVVLVCNEKEMPKQFKRVREKIIGRTISIEPQISAALEVFMSEQNDDSAAKFLRSHQELISHIFSQSNTSSLRVLRQVVQDLGRLRHTLNHTHVSNKVAMRELLGIFISMNIEVRTGQLTAGDIRKRTRTRFKFDMSFDKSEKRDEKPPSIVMSEHKYQPVNFQSDVVSDLILADMLVYGRYVQDDIVRMLDESRHFLSPDDLPPWKIVIKFDTLDDVTVDSGIRRMKDQFYNRKILDPGEMLHVFSLMMLMADNGTFEQNVEQIADACIKYIDDLLEKDLLAPLCADRRILNELYEAHDGHGYWVVEAYEAEFSRVKDHLTSARERALERRLPSWANELREIIANDGEKFYQDVCHNHNGLKPYARIPVLRYICPKSFVDAWLNGQGESWRYVSWALDERYREGKVPDALSDERPWAVEVGKLLKARADHQGGYQGLRIRRILPKSLNKLMKEEGTSGKGDSEVDDQ